jgi:septal ring factor EnvC (AmiA/AmiB activator)
MIGAIEMKSYDSAGLEEMAANATSSPVNAAQKQNIKDIVETNNAIEAQKAKYEELEKTLTSGDTGVDTVATKKEMEKVNQELKKLAKKSNQAAQSFSDVLTGGDSTKMTKIIE